MIRLEVQVFLEKDWAGVKGKLLLFDVELVNLSNNPEMISRKISFVK